MPREDGTGPDKMGPMTGRGAGYCAVSGMPGYASGFSGSCRRRLYPSDRFSDYIYTVNAADRKEFLKRQAEDLEYRLKQIKKMLSDTDK